MAEASIVPWFKNSRAEWDVSVNRWLTEIASLQGLGDLISLTIIKERPWSIIFRVQFAAAVAYFKACGAGGFFEPQLLHDLSTNRHIRVPELWALDSERGWLLLHDVGTLYRDSATITEQLIMLQQLLANYAQLQIDSLTDVEQYLTLGLTDRRLEKLPYMMESLLVDERLAVGRDEGSFLKLLNSARALLPRFASSCRDLAATSYAAALDHGDMHLGNVLSHNGEIYLIDWGDACVTHPFSSIMVTLETVLSHVPLAERQDWLWLLLEAYLAPWQPFASRAQLRENFPKAMWVAYAGRALNMAHMFTHAPQAQLDPWLPMIGEYLEKWVSYADYLERGEAAWSQVFSDG